MCQVFLLESDALVGIGVQVVDLVQDLVCLLLVTAVLLMGKLEARHSISNVEELLGDLLVGEVVSRGGVVAGELGNQRGVDAVWIDYLEYLLELTFEEGKAVSFDFFYLVREVFFRGVG